MRRGHGIWHMQQVSYTNLGPSHRRAVAKYVPNRAWRGSIMKCGVDDHRVIYHLWRDATATLGIFAFLKVGEMGADHLVWSVERVV